jgi:hypothetical protein
VLAVHDNVTLTANTAHVYGGAVILAFNCFLPFLVVVFGNSFCKG